MLFWLTRPCPPPQFFFCPPEYFSRSPSAPRQVLNTPSPLLCAPSFEPNPPFRESRPLLGLFFRGVAPPLPMCLSKLHKSRRSHHDTFKRYTIFSQHVWEIPLFADMIWSLFSPYPKEVFRDDKFLKTRIPLFEELGRISSKMVMGVNSFSPKVPVGGHILWHKINFSRTIQAELCSLRRSRGRVL